MAKYFYSINPVLWHTVQKPVERMRYPRAVNSNKNRIQRGGHVWFQRHVNPRKGSGINTSGLEVLWIDGELKSRAKGASRVSAQMLPCFDPASPLSDKLFGYDLFAGEGDQWCWKAGNRQTYHKKLEPFNPDVYATGKEKSGGFHGQNRQRRQDGRDRARGGKK